jgi:hypothetical protein
LVCEIATKLHQQATILAEEYNIGVLTWDANVKGQPIVLNTPTERSNLNEYEMLKLVSNWKKFDDKEKAKKYVSKCCDQARYLFQEAKGKLLTNIAERYLVQNNSITEEVKFGILNLLDEVQATMCKEKLNESERAEVVDVARLLIDLMMKSFQTEFDEERFEDFFKENWAINGSLKGGVEKVFKDELAVVLKEYEDICQSLKVCLESSHLRKAA